MARAIIVVIVLVLIGGVAYWYFTGNGNEPAPTKSPAEQNGETPSKPEGPVEKAVEWLKNARNDEGAWGAPDQGTDPGITALVLKSLALNDFTPENSPWVEKAVEKLLSFQREDGSIFKDGHQGYNTAICISALAEFEDKKYADAIENGKNYLIDLQYRPALERTKEDWYVGGWNYTYDPKSPNMSTTVFALEALRKAGVPEDHEVYDRALKFVQRCQNRSESNDVSESLGIVLTNDGGFFYKPQDTRGQVVEQENGKMTLKSYGSMTYAGLLSYAYCWVSKEDPRVQDTIEWIQKNYTFEENPGSLKYRQGLYYYLMTCAKAISAYGIAELPDGKPVAKDLRAKILELQNADGSWVNDDAERWWESNPMLCTAYMLIALGETDSLISD